jgi:hypothetical protein
MSTNQPSAQRVLVAASALLIAGVAIIFALRAVNDPLWSDELLTTHLLQAADLRKLWAGIALGIDGNPPLYLTAALLFVQMLPTFVSTVALLKLLNLAVTIAAVIALCRLGRRVVSSSACWIGALLFVTLNDNLVFVASELRTYALYVLIAALAMLFQQRLVERGRPRDIIILALAYVGLTLAHTFGIVYVGCIALAGWLSRPRDKSLLRATVIAAVPAVGVLLAWSPFLLEQLEVAKPYGWMTSPGWPELAETLFASNIMLWISVLEMVCLTVAGAAWLKQGGVTPRALVADPRWQPARYVAFVLAFFTAFTFAAWLLSMVSFPIFVPRFFSPQLTVSFALHTAFAAWLLSQPRQRWAVVTALCVVIGSLVLRNVLTHARNPVHGAPICADASGAFFEEPFVTGELPVITDTPHTFLPRAAYAVHPQAYRYPLDWDVVLNYPTRSRGNAVDYHIMQGLQTWQPLSQVMSTDDVVRAYPQFLVIETTPRAWFENLRATRKVEAEKLAQSRSADPGDVSCTLWKVTRVQDRF